MKVGRLSVLAAAWFACFIAPSLLVASGVFGHLDASTDINGGVIGVWIAGWLAQFGLFMWISYVGKPGVIGWIVSSVGAWAIDWTLPASPWFALVWIPLALFVAIRIVVSAQREESLKEHGIQATGTVLEVEKPLMNVIINDAYIKRKVRLNIQRADGAPVYEGTLDGLFMFGEIPSPGDRLALLVDPNNPQHFEYDGDDAAAPDVHDSQARSVTVGNDIADQLHELATLHGRGDLSDDEYAAAKKKLLD